MTGSGWRRRVMARALALACVYVAGPAMGQGAPTADATYPVTVSNCGEPLRIDRPPRRLVVPDLNMTEMALALGLRPVLVGVTGITGWYKQTGEALLRTLDGVPELAPKYPTLETLVAARPDLFFANQRGGNQLWRNVGGGRFADITAQAGVAMVGKVPTRI